MEKSEHKMSVAISWFVLAYFVVLFAERAQSICRILFDKGTDFFATGFDTYVNLLTVASLAAAFVMLIGFNGDFWRSLFNGSVVPNYSILAITAGVILVGGMVHTEYTIAPLQFGAYGALIVAMILRTAQTASAADSKLTLWYSLAYLTVFSMAIPVMYHSHIERASLFHILSAITALVLVFCFTYMLRLVFIGEAGDLLLILPVVLMAVLDTVVLVLRWNEEVNSFALIFAIASAAMFIIGKVIFAIAKK